MMRTAVFGGTGYIGSRLVSQLSQNGCDVTVLSRSPEVASTPSNRFVHGSLNDRGAVRETLQGADVVYHLAWKGVPASSGDSLFSELQENVQQSLQLFEACVENGIPRVVFCSTGGAVYGPSAAALIIEDHPLGPITPYGLAKLTVERYLEMFRLKHGLGYAIARPGNAYGGSQRTDGLQGIIGRLIWCAKNDEPVAMYGGGDVVRDFVHVEDVAAALCMLGRYTGDERVFNVSSGMGTSLKTVLELIESETNRTIKRQNLPARWFDIPRNVLDSSRLMAETGWRVQRDLAAEIRHLCL